MSARTAIDAVTRRGRALSLPADTFAVVMATGIVSVAARSTGHAATAGVLGVLAGALLVVVSGLVVAGAAVAGRSVVAGSDRLTRVLGLFSAVAAADVVAAALGAGRVVVTVALGVVATLLWAVLVARSVAALRARPAGTRGDGARGGWLLVVVATESLALTAAHLARAGLAPALLLGISAACWTLGLLAYAVVAPAIGRRLVLARADAELLTPDTWVLMGALAIATIAGGSLVLALPVEPALGPLSGHLVPVVVALWLLATAWIPLLLAGEIRRVRHRMRPGGRGRWATVFPLGMYSATGTVLALVLTAGGTVDPAWPATLHAVAGAAYWVALVAWGAVALDAARRGWRALGPGGVAATPV